MEDNIRTKRTKKKKTRKMKWGENCTDILSDKLSFKKTRTWLKKGNFKREIELFS